jgi:zona occludens toxin (predicted ATPase)
MNEKKARKIQSIYNTTRLVLLVAMLLAIFIALGTQ